jgi:phosphate-selective porin OprO and OprP
MGLSLADVLSSQAQNAAHGAEPNSVSSAAHWTSPSEDQRSDRKSLLQLSTPDDVFDSRRDNRILPATFNQQPLGIELPEPAPPVGASESRDFQSFETPGQPRTHSYARGVLVQDSQTSPGIEIPELLDVGDTLGGGLNPSVNVTGQVQVDTLTFNQSERNKLALGDLQNATGFRRSRLGAFGEIFETTEYRVEFDFAGAGRPRFLDNWIAIKGLGLPYLQNMIVGHFFEPFSIERYTPNRFITFLERSAVDEFAPARNTGLMLFDHTEGERVTWAAGLFRSDSNVYGDSVEDRSDWALTTHMTCLAWYDEETDGRYLLHLGASYSFRAAGDRVVRFTKRPENQLQAFEELGFPSFVDTGPIPAYSHQLLGAEAAWVHGPFSMQAEFVYAPVRSIAGPNLSFNGWYVYGSYFLTGENRSYSPTSILGRFREGIFQRITPRTNAFKGNVAAGAPRGPGAWEVAARWSHIDLNSHGVRGGQLHTLTLGLNWYLNPNTRIQWNYTHPILREDQFGRSYADIFGMRFGFEF